MVSDLRPATAESAAATTPAPGPARARRHHGAVAGYAFVLPGFILYAVIILYPAVRTFLMSLQDFNIAPGAVSTFIGLDNYVRAIQDPVLQQSFVNAAFYMVATVPAQIVLGLFVAVLLDSRLPGRTVYRVLFYVPVITSWVVVSLLFQYLFSTDRGVINWFLVDVTHLAAENVNWLGERWSAMIAISLLGIWKGIGWSMLIFLAALSGVPRELHEAAALDGAGVFRRFRYVTMPFIRGTLSVVIILLVIGGFNVFTSVLLMTDGGPQDQTQVPLTYMYKQAFTFLDFGYGSSISFLLTLVVLAFAGLQYWLTARKGQEGTTS